MALKFIESDLQTLVFANNRLATEVLVTYLKDACDRGPIPSETVRGYRGGYLPRERREIERQPARRRDPRGGGHQRARAGHRHRLARRRGDGRISRHHRLHLAARRPRRTAPGNLGGRAGGLQRAARSVHRRASRLFLRPLARARLHQSGQPRNPAGPPEVRGLRTAPARRASSSASTTLPSSAGFSRRADSCTIPPAPGTGPRTAIPPTPPACARSSSDNFVVVDITGEPKVIAEVSFPAALTTLHEKAIYLHEARQYHVERFDYDERKAYVTPRGLRLLHRRHRLHAGQDARGVRRRAAGRRRAPRPRRCAREPPDRRLQEDQVLHHGKRGRREALDARAGDAHHGVLAAFPGGVPGALGGFHPHRRAERHRRPGQCAAHRGRAAADVRPARSGRGPERGDRRRARSSSSRTCTSTTVSRRRRPERAALPSVRAACQPDRRAARRRAPAKPAARPASAPPAKSASAAKRWPRESWHCSASNKLEPYRAFNCSGSTAYPSGGGNSEISSSSRRRR